MQRHSNSTVTLSDPPSSEPSSTLGPLPGGMGAKKRSEVFEQVGGRVCFVCVSRVACVEIRLPRTSLVLV